ncbi:MAG: enoyl-[acyl-carrier-protein] reductase FabI [Stappia sp.]|uniref:enoyl-ACP reductase FabI n=1 Tax=Stappia sp. TaxID=1870903 RepID=UPI000C48BB55|nr:enoyl-ACP reductase FabI [Stappia sp.]MAA97734.1 enoyl-[acyl-carrier-protein] reductase FabI [Stappia sp.]MBM20650.1 enoyl-[acyl-carrier-protein] reductase FabI [Stappia sp.]|tara:strand:+ start:111 stop:875 length:765 start_codon:yes stop_codon:yes gene_type:complete
MFSLSGKKALVVGIANSNSIAYGCAKAFRDQGADLAITWLNDKARPYVEPLAEELGAEIIAPLDVRSPGAMESVFETIEGRWGSLDILLHSIAFAPKEDLHGRVIDCSAEGFATAMDVSVHSFLRMIRLAEPLMKTGGTCLSVSFFGSARVVPNYNLMGPVKAALESAVRYAAFELGQQRIRVHALSPGPLATRAASGIDHFDVLLEQAAARAPTHQLATIADVGAMAAFLASDEAANLTGGVHDIDGGYSVTA